MKITGVDKMKITETDFVNAFKKRDMYKDKFSHDGLLALFHYFEEQECEEVGVAYIYSNYSEYDNLEQLQNDYQSLYIKSLDDLIEYSSFIKVPNTEKIIIEDF